MIGNSFAHKYVSATVDALAGAFPRDKIVALGLNEDKRHNVTAYASGHLSDDQMRNLLRGARVVVFPSHYEGFGIPVLESLAYGKPVLARSIPVMRELREQIASKDNLILYESTRDLFERLSNHGFPKWQPDTHGVTGNGTRAAALTWDSGTADMGRFLWSLFDSWSFTEHLLPRLAYMRILEDHSHHLRGPLPTATPGGQTEADTKLRKRVDPQVIDDLNAIIRDREARITDLEELPVVETDGAGPGAGQPVYARSQIDDREPGDEGQQS